MGALVGSSNPRRFPAEAGWRRFYPTSNEFLERAMVVLCDEKTFKSRAYAMRAGGNRSGLESSALPLIQLAGCTYTHYPATTLLAKEQTTLGFKRISINVAVQFFSPVVAS